MSYDFAEAAAASINRRLARSRAREDEIARLRDIIERGLARATDEQFMYEPDSLTLDAVCDILDEHDQ